MKTHVRIHPGVSQDKVRHLLEDHFERRRLIGSWNGEGSGNSYVSVELTHAEPLSLEDMARLGEIGTPYTRG